MAADRSLAGATRAATDVALTGLSGVLERTSRRVGTLTVLTYHRVSEPDLRPDLHPGLVSAGPREFEQQIRWVARHAQPVTVDAVLEARRGGEALPARAVLVTFDDGYSDFASDAWPVLRAAGVPVVLFVPTALPGTGATFWWDRLRHAIVAAPHGTELDTPAGRWRLTDAASRDEAFAAIRSAVPALGHVDALAMVDDVVGAAGVAEPRSAVLSWDELRALRGEGVTLAPHSRTHPLLHRIDRDRLDDEVAGSFADLEQQVGPVPPVFAYPGGGFDDAVVAATARAGFQLAVTTERGVVDPRSVDWLRVPRVNVGRRTNVPLIRAQLQPTTHRVLGLMAARRRPGGTSHRPFQSSGGS